MITTGRRLKSFDVRIATGLVGKLNARDLYAKVMIAKCTTQDHTAQVVYVTYQLASSVALKTGGCNLSDLDVIIGRWL